jgi:PAS domain-containing protein
MQSLLDMRTIFFCAALVAGAFALLLLWVARTRKTYPGYGCWAGTEVAFTLIFLWQTFRDRLPGPGTVVFGNLTVCCAMILVACGMRRFCGSRFHTLPVYLVAVAYIGLIGYFYFHVDSFWMRTLLSGIYMAAMGIYAAIPFLDAPPKGRELGYRFTASVLLFGAAIGAIRVIAVMRMPEVKSIFFVAKINTVYCLTDLVFIIALSLAFFLLTDERQVADLKDVNQEIALEVVKRQQAEIALQAHRDRLQTEVAEQTATIRASEQRYRTLFDRNLAAAFHASKDRLLDCNQAMCQLLGYSHEELLALELSAIRFHPMALLGDENCSSQRENQPRTK